MGGRPSNTWMKDSKVVTILAVPSLALLIYSHFSSRSLAFTQERWKNALEEKDRVSLYRMSEDLSEKVDEGLIRSRVDAEEILGVEEFERIGLSRPAYLVLTIPYYLSLRFDQSGVLIDHGVYPD